MAFSEIILLCVLSVCVFYAWQRYERFGGLFLRSQQHTFKDVDVIADINLQPSDWLLLLCIICFVTLASMQASSCIQSYFGKDSVNAVFVYALIFQCLVLSGIIAFKRMSSVQFEFGFIFNVDIIKKSVKCFVCSLIIVMFLGVSINLAIYLLTGTLPEKQDIINTFSEVESPLVMGSAIFSFLVLAPITEELFFRGILYRSFKGVFRQITKSDFSKYVSAMITSLLFSTAHDNAFAFVPLFAFALLLTGLYERTQSIFSTMLCHSAFNFFNVILIVLFL